MAAQKPASPVRYTEEMEARQKPQTGRLVTHVVVGYVTVMATGQLVQDGGSNPLYKCPASRAWCVRAASTVEASRGMKRRRGSSRRVAECADCIAAGASMKRVNAALSAPLTAARSFQKFNDERAEKKIATLCGVSLAFSMAARNPDEPTFLIVQNSFFSQVVSLTSDEQSGLSPHAKSGIFGIASSIILNLFFSVQKAALQHFGSTKMPGFGPAVASVITNEGPRCSCQRSFLDTWACAPRSLKHHPTRSPYKHQDKPLFSKLFVVVLVLVFLLS